MKLLFDQNLSPRLVERLADLFPDSQHVYNLDLDAASDDLIWSFAREQGFAVVTKDEDFSDVTTVRGFPPKVIWLRTGNCTTQWVEEVLRSHHRIIRRFDADPEKGIFSIY